MNGKQGSRRSSKNFSLHPPRGSGNGQTDWLPSAITNVREIGAALRAVGTAYWNGGYDVSLGELVGLYRELQSRKTQAAGDVRRLRELIRASRAKLEALRRRLDGDE